MQDAVAYSLWHGVALALISTIVFAAAVVALRMIAAPPLRPKTSKSDNRLAEMERQHAKAAIDRRMAAE